MKRTYVILWQPSFQPSSNITSTPFGGIFSSAVQPWWKHKTKYMFSDYRNQRQPSGTASRTLLLLGIGWWAQRQAQSIRRTLSGVGIWSRVRARAQVTVRVDSCQQQNRAFWLNVLAACRPAKLFPVQSIALQSPFNSRELLPPQTLLINSFFAFKSESISFASNNHKDDKCME